MKIEYSNSSYCSWDTLGDASQTPFKSKEGCSVMSINVNKESKHWQMEFCHEMGHILLVKEFSIERYNYSPSYKVRIEMMAHRIAKSICKARYWNEEHAITMLKTYFKDYDILVNMDKFRKNGIIPLNKGIKIE